MSHIAPEPLPASEDLIRLRTLLHQGARPRETAPAPLTLAARFGTDTGDAHPCPCGGFPGHSGFNPRAKILAMGPYGRT